MLEVKELYCGYDEVDIIKNVSFKMSTVLILVLNPFVSI